MGNFYTNVVVRGPSEADVAATLGALRRTSLVVTHPTGFVFVYDSEADTQKEGAIESLALTLATRLRCPALAALNHDDDALLLWLYAPDGTEVRFGSGVRFDDEDRPSNADSFAEEVRRVFGSTPSSEPDPFSPWQMRLIKLLAPRLSAMAINQHTDILRQSGIPIAPATLGYRYVEQGELADREPELTVRRVP